MSELISGRVVGIGPIPSSACGPRPRGRCGATSAGWIAEPVAVAGPRRRCAAPPIWREGSRHQSGTGSAAVAPRCKASPHHRASGVVRESCGPCSPLGGVWRAGNTPSKRKRLGNSKWWRGLRCTTSAILMLEGGFAFENRCSSTTSRGSFPRSKGKRLLTPS